MFERIRSLLRDGGEEEQGVPKPAAVKEAIRETESELEVARERLSELQDQHGPMLLRGSDEEVDAHEAKIAETEREIARLEVALPRLEDELQKAEERAAEREKKRKLARGAQLKEEFAELNERYAELASEMVPVIERMAEIEREVEQLQKEAGSGPNRECVPPGREAYHRNSRPWRDNVVVPAGPESPALNARWHEHRKSPSTASEASKKREVSISDAETGEPTRGVGSRGQRLGRVVSEGIS